jgi:hypothetical protein
MKALTVWQPWASLIIAGAKPYEFRGWRFPSSMIGERIVIHAATKKLDVHETSLLETVLIHNPRRAAETCLIIEKAVPVLERALDGPGLPLAAGLGTAVLGEPRNGLDIAAEFGVPRANDSNRDEHANWGWPMLDIEAWPEPIPMRGAQGFWRWPVPADVLA